MMGMGKELEQLQNEAEIKGHTGFCMADYDKNKCWDCPTEFECLKLFVKEKADVVDRTIVKMREVQDGKSD